jgi:hypothetical protein
VKPWREPNVREFWVVGGEYASTAFDRLAAGAAEEHHGPYASYPEALAQWRRLSLRRIDECQVRYRVIESETERLPRVANG